MIWFPLVVRVLSVLCLSAVYHSVQLSTFFIWHFNHKTAFSCGRCHHTTIVSSHTENHGCRYFLVWQRTTDCNGRLALLAIDKLSALDCIWWVAQLKYLYGFSLSRPPFLSRFYMRHSTFSAIWAL